MTSSCFRVLGTGLSLVRFPSRVEVLRSTVTDFGNNSECLVEKGDGLSRRKRREGDHN